VPAVTYDSVSALAPIVENITISSQADLDRIISQGIPVTGGEPDETTHNFKIYAFTDYPNATDMRGDGYLRNLTGVYSEITEEELPETEQPEEPTIGEELGETTPNVAALSLTFRVVEKAIQ
jgi:hypothetical protein